VGRWVAKWGDGWLSRGDGWLSLEDGWLSGEMGGYIGSAPACYGRVRIQTSLKNTKWAT